MSHSFWGSGVWSSWAWVFCIEFLTKLSSSCWLGWQIPVDLTRTEGSSSKIVHPHDSWWALPFRPWLGCQLLPEWMTREWVVQTKAIVVNSNPSSEWSYHYFSLFCWSQRPVWYQVGGDGTKMWPLRGGVTGGHVELSHIVTGLA